MIRFHIPTSLTLGLFISLTAQAGLYKGLDSEGNVSYSDKPFANAETITPPALTVIDAPKIDSEKNSKVDDETVSKDTPQTSYTRLSISSPQPDQVIWNEPDLMVALKVSPALATKEGHTTWLLLDGKPLVRNSRSLHLPIGRADRGEHTIQAQIRNQKGRILKRSKTITIHLKYSVISATPR